MPILDVFKADGFSAASLTAAIQKVQFLPGRIGRLGIFNETGIMTSVAQVEEIAGQLSLIQSSPRGAPASTLGAAKRKLRTFPVPHLVRESSLLADEVLNVRAFGSENELQTLQALLTVRMAELRQAHEATLEYHRARALQGIVLDADGSTLLNLFTAFEVTQQTKGYLLTTATTDVRQKCVDTARLIEDEMGGTPYTELRGLCSASFFDALVGHDLVKDTFKYQQGFVLREDLRYVGFTFGGVIWEEYRGKVGSTKYIEDDEAYVFPVGTGPASIFATYWAPADFVDEIGIRIGLPIYAKQAADPEFQRWVKLHTQSNPLNLCLRPRAVVKCTKV